MKAQKIGIQHLGRRKEFYVATERYNEFISLIEYYGYDYCLKDTIFVYSNPITFNIIDLNLSYVSTPQPVTDVLSA